MVESDPNAIAMEKWDADLARIHEEWTQTRSTDNWKKYVISCVAYFCSENFSISNKHWFCDSEKTRKRAVSSLTVLSFEESSTTKRYQELYREKLAHMLANCHKCAIKYEISSPDLMESLVENSKVPCEIVETFYKNMERSDKARLADALTKDENSFPALSEALWSSACLASSKFIGEHFSEAGPLKNGDPQEVAKFDANPGFVLFKFMALHNLRRATLRTVVGDDSNNYIEAWKSAPRLFRNALIKGLKRNTQATDLADPAWFTVATIFRALNSDREISNSIIDLSCSEMASASGIPKFGASYLVYVILKAKSSDSNINIYMDTVEEILDYVTKKAPELHYPSPLPKQLTDETTSASYRDLDAQVVIEWFKHYIALRPSADRIKDRVSFILGLKMTAFKTNSNYQNAILAALKAASLYPNELYDLVVMQHEDRLFEVYDRFSADAIYHLWKYQQEHENTWSPLWLRIVRDPLFGTRILANKQILGVVIGLLKGSGKVGLKWQAPTKVVAARDLQVKNNSDGQQKNNNQDSSPAEETIASLLEQICDVGEPENLKSMILDKHILRNSMILSISGNKRLSIAANDFISLALGDDSLENAINSLVKDNPELLLSAVNSILEASAPASATWLAAMPGLIKLLLRVLDDVYDVTNGIDTVTNSKITLGLQIFWTRSWEMIANLIRQIKDWAAKYHSNYLKPLLINVLEFSKGLLSKFRLVEADLTDSKLPKQNWGSLLAAPVISSVTNMSALLQLAIPDLLAMAFDIIIDMLELMSSFQVSEPESLLSLLERLATRRTRSKLSKEQLKVLLIKVGLTEDETNQVVDQQITGIVLKKAATPDETDSRDPAVPSGSQEKGTGTFMTSTKYLSTQSHSQSQSQQKSIGDFFKTTTGNKLILPPRKIINNQVLPNAAPQVSALSQIRAQLQENTTSGTRLLSATNRIGPIHPERPPGFNQPKPIASHSDNSDDSDDSDDGALGALGAEKKREEARLKLKQAYEASLSGKTQGPTVLPTIGKIGPSKQLQNEQKQRELRAMKARLNAKPTELHRVLLSWDYFSDKAPVQAKEKIPAKFDSVEQYQAIMSPLLYLEAWEGIQRSKEESAKCSPTIFQLIFGKRVKVDGFTDVYVTMTKSNFAASRVNDSSFLLLGYSSATADEEILPSPGIPHFLARIKSGSILISQNPKKQYVDFQIRLNVELGALYKLDNGSTVNGVSIGTFTTVEREFTALTALSHYSLVKNILEASPTVAHDFPDQISRLQTNLGLNRSQATAVSRAMTNHGFSLIQGPPGTGKTKTILGIIGALFTNGEMNAKATGESIKQSQKILVCAPSNAAVDEIVLRLKEAVLDSHGVPQKFNVLRMGRYEAVSEQNRDVTLEDLIASQLDNNAEVSDSQLRREHTELTIERNEVRDKLKNVSDDNKLSEAEVSALSNKLRSLSVKLRDKCYALDAQREGLEQARKRKDAEYKRLQAEIVSKAQIICTTLSGSAQPLLKSLKIEFDTVIIDEAAQSIELSSLIPLKYGATKCILVGDPNQLPPTVLSKAASILHYEQSLFVRMYNQYKDVPGAVSMLDTQFRMHPEISRFPSAEFYSGKLLDGANMADKTDRPWHHEFRALGPYTFFNVKGTHEKYNGHSLRNQAEASAALGLVKYIHRNYPEVKSIGVISPYKEQVRLLQQTFVQSLGADVISFVDFNSIDGFQGQEKDIIIMSCVRAADAKVNNIGFLADVRRMNVGLTRAKASLWVLGHAGTLKVNPVWERLIKDASSRGHLVEAQTSDIMQAVKRFNAVTVPVGKRRWIEKESAKSPVEVPRKIVRPDDGIESDDSSRTASVEAQGDVVEQNASLEAARDVVEQDEANEEDIVIKNVHHNPIHSRKPRKFNKGPPNIFIQSNRSRKKM